MTTWELEEEKTERRGNPIASARWRWQTYTIEGDYPLESEWEQFKQDAIRLAARDLIRNFEKFKKDDIVIKIYNEMNYKKDPIIITLDDAYKLTQKIKPCTEQPHI